MDSRTAERLTAHARPFLLDLAPRTGRGGIVKAAGLYHEHAGLDLWGRRDRPGRWDPLVQLSNFPDVRPARRLLVSGSVLFGAMFTLNLVASVLAFVHQDSDRWLNLVRLAGNIVFAVLSWRGFVRLAALAERAAIYQRA